MLQVTKYSIVLYFVTYNFLSKWVQCKREMTDESIDSKGKMSYMNKKGEKRQLTLVHIKCTQPMEHWTLQLWWQLQVSSSKKKKEKKKEKENKELDQG